MRFRLQDDGKGASLEAVQGRLPTVVGEHKVIHSDFITDAVRHNSLTAQGRASVATLSRSRPCVQGTRWERENLEQDLLGFVSLPSPVTPMRANQHCSGEGLGERVVRRSRFVQMLYSTGSRLSRSQ